MCMDLSAGLINAARTPRRLDRVCRGCARAELHQGCGQARRLAIRAEPDDPDAGVRSGEQVAKDMIAVRIGPDMRMAVVGAPSYFKGREEPGKPQDLIAHRCINLRLPTRGSLYAWEFERGNRELKVRVEGQLTCNGTAQLLNGALAGLGLAYVPEGMVEQHIAKARLRRVLEDWCPPYSGYHLFYPSRRQSSAAFNLLVEALRYRR